jgi:hypothetical protein|nr:MAG TPA: hypothetical protein [Caudoviricetes sp.]
MTNKENERTEEKKMEQENNVFIDNLGRLNIKEQEIYVDAEGTLKEFDFRLTKPQNYQVYTNALLKFSTDKDVPAFAATVLPKMVEKPNEARKLNFFEYDEEALFELVAAIIDYMGKPKEKKKRKLNMTLK